jgi:lipoate-protein ligase A
MRLLDLTLPTPEENLALDEALLNSAEADDACSNVLRLWESPQSFVVVGRASKLEQEVNLAACRAANIPVLRRCSGGTAIVAGLGCLMYGIILGYDQFPQLRIVEQAHAYVMERMRSALATLSSDVQVHGASDLTLGNHKISGNSLRCKRRCLLYHGTVLYDFPLVKISGLLGNPPRQPDYRRGRDHTSFVTNFPFTPKVIRNAICLEWQAMETLDQWPEQRMAELVDARYSHDSWNARL